MCVCVYMKDNKRQRDREINSRMIFLLLFLTRNGHINIHVPAHSEDSGRGTILVPHGNEIGIAVTVVTTVGLEHGSGWS